MFAITLNPGFVCLLAGLLVLAAPRAFRPATIAGAAMLALWLMLDREFGAAEAARQMGLPVVLLSLDALNRIFGIAMLIALIVIGLSSGARRNRVEDAAILILAGSAVSALFVGDLVSFVAAASLSGLTAAWLTFCSPARGSAQSGVRLLIWFGIEGLLFLVGVSFQLSAGAASSIFARLDANTLGGAFIFAALLFRVGAPFAHVWLKDAIAHASPVGAGALAAFSTMLGVYGLARLFPAEPLLLPIGMVMAAIGAVYAVAEDDLRRAAASGLTAQTGACVMLIGIGSPLALAAAEGHAFTLILAFLALNLALGAIFGRTGDVRASAVEGLAKSMPISAALLCLAGLAATGAPSFAAYVTNAIALEAMAQWQSQLGWIALSALPAALFVALMLRPALIVYRALPGASARNEAPFPMLLGVGLAVFFCASIGLAPGWLYGLLPAAPAFQPFEIGRLAPYAEMLGAVGVAYILMRALRLTHKEMPLNLLDVDALYRGPAAGAGRWLGVVLLRLYGTWRAAWARVGAYAARVVGRLSRACDRPYRAAPSAAAPLAAAAISLAIALLMQSG